MPSIMLLFATSCAFSILLGSLGVFFVYASFLRPEIGADAIICLLAATALVWARTPKKDYSSNRRTR